jgi:hypothetical protein
MAQIPRTPRFLAGLSVLFWLQLNEHLNCSRETAISFNNLYSLVYDLTCSEIFEVSKYVSSITPILRQPHMEAEVEWNACRLAPIEHFIQIRRRPKELRDGVNPVTSDEQPVHHAAGMSAAAARSAA